MGLASGVVLFWVRPSRDLMQHDEVYAELDQLARSIDRARQEQGAHRLACFELDGAECRPLQRRRNGLHLQVADLLAEAEQGGQ